MSQQNCWLLLLIALCLVLALYLLRRERRRKFRLEEDKSGFRKYHRETTFRRKDAYGEQLAQDGGADSKEASPKKKQKTPARERKAVAVLKFQGDLRAKQHNLFANLVDELEVNKDRLTEVVVCVTSPGGAVPHYGHVFAQMERIRSLGVPLTVCIDVVAASGGYLASLPANRIIAAPFAIVGSVGVVAFVPNIRKLLLRWDVNPRTFTAGRFKRTVSLTDEESPEELAHFQRQLTAIHDLFQRSVQRYRPAVNLEVVGTGDHWTAAESIEHQLGLVDELGTSHEYLMKRNRETDLVYLSSKKGFWDEGVGRFFSALVDVVEERVLAWGMAGVDTPYSRR